MAPPTGVAVAQSASIAGVPRDVIGQTLPGVTVTTIPESGGLVKRTTSGRDGAYRFEALPDGTYRVDFELLGFDLIRRNHVRVRPDTVATVDAVLPVSAICECVTVVPPSPLRQRAGRVVDESDRPLPHAHLEVVSSIGREVAYADDEGRFLVRAPINEMWPLTASDTGFRAVTQQLSGAVAEPIELRLAHAGTTGVPNEERLARGCRCPGRSICS